MKNKLIILLILIIVNIGFLKSQEVTVPLDTTGTIMMLDDEMCQRYNLYPEYPNIREVFIFKISDNQYRLEISYVENDIRKKATKPLTFDQYEKYKLDLSSKIYTGSYNNLATQKSGRVEFISSTVAYSLGLWGWTVPNIFDLEGSAYFGTYLLSAGTGFLITYGATSSSHITEGMARLSTYGAPLGAWHATLASFILDLDWNTSYTYDPITGNETRNNNDFPLISGLLLAGSAGEFIANYNIARNFNYSLGRASAVGTYAMLGSAVGPLSYLALSNFDEMNLPTFGTVSLVTSVAGYVAGHYITDEGYYAAGDANMLSSTSILGAALPFSVYFAIGKDEITSAGTFGSLLAGSLAGAVLGDHLSKKVNLTESQGNYLNLAFLGGALIGTGLGVIMFADANNNSSFYIPLVSTLGGVAGFVPLLNYYWDRAVDKKYASNWDMNFNLAGLIGMYTKSEVGTPKIDRATVKLPVFDLKYTFK